MSEQHERDELLNEEPTQFDLDVAEAKQRILDLRAALKQQYAHKKDTDRA